MPANGSLAGLTAELRETAIGDHVARAISRPAGPAAREMEAFHRSVGAAVAKVDATFTTTSLTSLSSDLSTLIRCIVITRTA